MTNIFNLEHLLVVCVLLGLLGWTLRTVAADARRRGESPVLVTFLVLLSFPWGLIVWLLVRPKPLDGGDKGFRLEDHRVQ